MNGMRKFLAMVVTIAALSAPAAAPAATHNFCYKDHCVGAVIAEFTAFASTIVGSISSAANLLVATLTQGTLQISAEIEKLAMTTTKAAEAALSYKQEKQLVEKAVELQTETFARPVECCSGEANQGMVSASSKARQVAARNTKRFTDSYLRKGGVSSSLEVVKRHKDLYCTAQEAADGLCVAATGGMEGADMDVSTLLHPSGGEMYTPAEMRAAAAFIENVVNPVRQTSIPQDWANTQQGQVLVAEEQANLAALSLARQTFSRIHASRMTPEKE